MIEKAFPFSNISIVSLRRKSSSLACNADCKLANPKEMWERAPWGTSSKNERPSAVPSKKEFKGERAAEEGLEAEAGSEEAASFLLTSRAKRACEKSLHE